MNTISTELPYHPVIPGMQAIGIGKRGPIWPVMGGSEDGGDGGGGEGGSSGGNEGAGETFTQAQLDKIVGQRVAEERAKYADYDDAKAKAAKYDAEDAEGKTPDQRISALETQLAEERSARQKAEVAQLRSDRAAGVEGFPKSLVKKLTGTTAEEIDAEITEIMGDLKITTDDRRPDGSGGSSRGGGNQAKPSTMSAGTELYNKFHPKSK